MTLKRFTQYTLILLLAGAAGIGLQRWLQPPGIPEPPPDTFAAPGAPSLFRSTPGAASPKTQTRPVGTADRTAAAHEPSDASDGTNVVDAIPGEYTLTFFNAADRDAFEALAARYGIRILDRMRIGNALRLAAPDKAQLQALLKAAPHPLSLTQNVVVRLPPLPEGPSAEAPSTPYVGFGSDALAWLGAPEPAAAWGKGVRIAVLDTGITAGFSGTVAYRLDLTGEGSGTATHGSAVASLISGNQGLAPGASLLDIKVLSDSGTGDAFTLAKGIYEAVERGADIINLSAGTRGDSPVLEEAVAYALERGVLLVASAGNDGLAGVSYPAGYDGVTAVGGVDADGRHLYFSNTGSTVDLSAPGIGIALSPDDNGEDHSFSGTSAAAPFVTAAAAILKAESPSLPPEELTRQLCLYSTDTGAPGRDDEIGSGILNVGWLMSRREPGIVDMAVSPPFILRDEARGVITLDLYGQNRGTTPLSQVEMTVTRNGDTQVLQFMNVGVGATTVHSLELPAAEVDANGLDLTVALRPVGEVDAQPRNNAKRTVILPAK